MRARLPVRSESNRWIDERLGHAQRLTGPSRNRPQLSQGMGSLDEKRWSNLARCASRRHWPTTPSIRATAIGAGRLLSFEL